jgi:N-acetylneuraminic acid mutarotase
MPSTLNYPKVALLNGRIYVVGAHYGEHVNNSLFEYNPVTDNWTVRKSMPSSRLYFAVAACQNRIYVIGGSLNPQDSYAPEALSINEVYDPVTDTWESRASMPTARWGLIAETVNGKIYVISGRTGGGKTSVKVN